MQDFNLFKFDTKKKCISRCIINCPHGDCLCNCQHKSEDLLIQLHCRKKKLDAMVNSLPSVQIF